MTPADRSDGQYWMKDRFLCRTREQAAWSTNTIVPRSSARQQLRHDWKVSDDQADGDRIGPGAVGGVVRFSSARAHQSDWGIQPDPQGAGRRPAFTSATGQNVNPLT